MRKNSTKFILGFIAIISFLALAISSTENVSAASYSTTLYYGDYYEVTNYKTLDVGDEIYWSFSTSNNVWLDVWILDDENWVIFDGGGTASGYHVSDYQGTSDSGTWEVQYSDVWYVLFWHADSYDSMATTVSMTVRFPGSIGPLAIVGIAIGALVLVGVIIGIAVAVKRKNASQVVYGSPQTQTYQPVVTQQPISPYYSAPPPPPPAAAPTGDLLCSFCGQTNKTDNRFCISCGADLSNQ